MFEALLERLAQSLDRRSVPYMIIGGQAVLLYAEPRLTRDIDVTLGLSVARLPALLDARESCDDRQHRSALRVRGGPHHPQARGRPRDMEDVRSVLLKNPRYDRPYVQRWLADFEQITGAPLRAALADLERDLA
jgi:hypothetical protein